MKTEIPPEIEQLLSKYQPLTKEKLDALENSAKELEWDSEFEGQYQTGRFVEHIFKAMEKDGVSKADLARRWGKSPQYVSKIFREDKPANFTIKTMVELMMLLRRKIKIDVVDPKESAMPIFTAEILEALPFLRRFEKLEIISEPYKESVLKSLTPDDYATTARTAA
jgi:AraC-like DNA-binding protein